MITWKGKRVVVVMISKKGHQLFFGMMTKKVTLLTEGPNSYFGAMGRGQCFPIIGRLVTRLLRD